MIDGTKLVSKPNINATFCWLIGLIIVAFAALGDTPYDVARKGAIGVAIVLAVSLAFEVAQNWRAVLRPDTVAFLALYGLTFLEFLLPQPEVNDMTNAGAMRHAVLLALLAFGSMAIGRHFSPNLPSGLAGLVRRPTPPSVLLLIFWISFFFGIFYMLLAVNFNPLEMIDQMMGPRFSQPWVRGRYGDSKALLNEVGAVINLVPPLAGLILSDRQRYRPLTWISVALVYAFCLFMGLAGSTRNVLGAYIITFLIAYSLNLTRKRVPEFCILSLLMVAGFFASSKIMLETRTIGLKEYLQEHRGGGQADVLKFEEEAPETIFFDLNLVNVAELADVFPKTHAFLGFEVPYVAFTHPIPRALWPGKPIGLSISMEDALGVGPEMTISSTFIGESYMAAGAFGVALAGLFFGMITGWWGRLTIGLSSALGLLIYASGFLAVVISMRSLFTLTVTILPTIAAIVMAMIFTRKPPDQADLTSRQIPHGIMRYR